MRRGWVIVFGKPDAFSTTEIRQETFEPAWRAGFSVLGGDDFLLPIPFGRRRDAEACVRFMKSRIPAPERLTLDEFRDQFSEIANGKQETVDHLVATCCQW